MNDATDGAIGKVGLACPGGSVLRVVDCAPHSRSPLHRKRSLDAGIVVDGELEAGGRQRTDSERDASFKDADHD